MSGELVRYGQDLPRRERQQLQATFAEALNGKLKVAAIWAVADQANESTVKVEKRRRELVEDDPALSKVTAQYMAAACASTQRVVEGLFGDVF